MLNAPQSRAARALLDWTQADLAARSNLSVVTIRDFEKGRRIPGPNNLLGIRHAFEREGIVFFNDGSPGARLMLRPEAA